MSSPLFYDKLVPLNRDRHRNLKLKADRLQRFAAGTHFVPLAAIEFYEAASDYPVVFSGGETASPGAMVGVRAGENLFVGDDGRWENGAYLPAYVARFPFILVRVDEKSDYTVCLDESYEGLSEADGDPLFDDEGKESELMSRIIGVLKDLLTETERTRRFVERLKALDLLTVRNVQVQDRSGKWYGLQDFRVVDEKKLAELDDGVIGELHRSGYLGCIYAHLFSLGNIARLGWRVPVDQAEAEAARGTAAASS